MQTNGCGIQYSLNKNKWKKTREKGEEESENGTVSGAMADLQPVAIKKS